VPATSLLDPVLKANACPLAHERFELRTKTLGCGCSTATFLTLIVTVVSTILALLIMYAIVKCLRSVDRIYGSGARRGWEIEIHDDGSMSERLWVRRRSVKSWFRHEDLSVRSEQQEVTTERSRLIPSS
jgi:hypothetical protein